MEVEELTRRQSEFVEDHSAKPNAYAMRVFLHQPQFAQLFNLAEDDCTRRIKRTTAMEG